MTPTVVWLAATSITTPTTAATSNVDPTSGHGEEWGKAAPIGLLMIVLLLVAGYFLARSFSKQMRKVPASFDPAVSEPAEAAIVTPGPAPTPPRPKAGKRSGSGGNRSG